MPRSCPLRAVFFDAGNTLLRMNYSVIADALTARGVSVTACQIERAELLARVRLDADLEAIVSDRRRAAGREPDGALGSGVSTESHSTAGRYLRYLLEGLGVVDDTMVAAMSEWRRRYNPPVGVWNVPDPDAETALRLVRDAGLRAAVISNSNGSVRSILETVGLTRYLDFVIDSQEVGLEKPDARIFRLALERAGLEPAEAIYIGDLYSVDVLGARGVGLGAVLLDPGGCWGERDCPAAAGVLGAVRKALDGLG